MTPADLRTRLESARVPARALDACLAPVTTEAVAVAQAFLATDDSFLVLSGPPGSGKTVAGAYAIGHLPGEVKGEIVNPFTNETQVITTPRSALFADAHLLAQASNFDVDTWNPVQRVHLLVIDDTGRELLDGTGRALGNLVNLLCRRHDDRKRTLITTNMAPKAWIGRYCTDGGRLLDRISEQERRHGRPAFHQVITSTLRTAAAPAQPATPSRPASAGANPT